MDETTRSNECLLVSMCVGAEFQKCMDFVLGPEEQDFVTIYVDNTIIMSETLLDHLRKVFQQFLEHNETVNSEKSKFFLT